MGPWLAARAAARDLPAAGYACGRYWAVARRRAACWERVLRRWGRLAPGTDGTAGAEMSSGKGPRAGEGGADVDVLACAAHLGRRSLVLRGGAVALRFEWAVGLDWAGDATSSVRASATFPSACMFSSSFRSITQLTGTRARCRRTRGAEAGAAGFRLAR
jgi:hypothetical protein